MLSLSDNYEFITFFSFFLLKKLFRYEMLTNINPLKYKTAFKVTNTKEI